MVGNFNADSVSFFQQTNLIMMASIKLNVMPFIVPHVLTCLFVDFVEKLQWDMLSHRLVIRKVASIPKGENPGNCVSLLRANVSICSLSAFTFHLNFFKLNLKPNLNHPLFALYILRPHRASFRSFICKRVTQTQQVPTWYMLH